MNDWHKNSWEDPFFAQKEPVEVETDTGKKYVLTCPRCAGGMMDFVKRWRFAPEDPLKPVKAGG
jgi:hypothetical protein